MLKKIFLLTIIPLVLFVFVLPVFGADYLPKNPENAGNISVSGPENYRNLYIGGGNIVVNKRILGDLFAAGGSINIFGPIEKDLITVGGNINVSNPVGEDMRAAGGNITLNSPVGGDLLIAGGTISLSKDANIGGDLWAAGGVINLNNNIVGDTKIAGGEILINGNINGNLEVRADKKLIFGSQSRVLGKITYSGTSEAIIQEGAQVSPIEFKMIEKNRYIAAGKFFTAFFFIKIIALLAASFVIIKIFGKTSLSIISYSHQRPWKSLGVGFLGLIVIPIAIALLMITVVGLYIGALLGVWFVFALLMSGVFMILLTGSLIEKWIVKKREVDLSWQTALLGTVGVGIITLIPFIGWLAILILCLISFGGLLRTIKQRLEFNTK